MTIRKRDGSLVPFDKQRIITAINKAFLDVYDELYETETAEDIATEIETIIDKSNRIFTVEDIQDLVEDKLMWSELKEVAKAYIRFRYKKEIARKVKSDFFDAVGEKLEARNVQNQNANVDEHSFGGRIGEAASLMTRQYAIDNLLSPMAKKNHLENRIYIHDLDHYAVGDHNCLSVPIDDLLANGFKTRQTDVRPANSVNTAMQLVAVLFQLQSLQQFGGVSATHIDWTMIPYVRKSFGKHYKDGLKWISGIDEDRIDYEIKNMLTNINTYSIEDAEWEAYNYQAYDYAMAMTKKETHQAVEGLYHNLNTLQSRSGNQLPFTSINYGTCILPEGRLINEEMLDVLYEGLGALHRTSIFPCGIFQVMNGVNKHYGEPNYYLFRKALKCTAKRLYPNYANVDWSGNAGYDRNDPTTYFSTMGCRTANGMDINADPGQNPQRKDGRGNICPVTIILPTLAMEAKESFTNEYDDDVISLFFIILDQAISDAKDMLIERFEWICSQDPSSAKFMYENGLMLGYKPEEGIRSALKHGTLAIGQLGLAEALQILIGKDHTTPEGMELAKRIEELFKVNCSIYKKKYHLNFGVYYTPAENLCYTAMKRFRNKYGVIENVSDKDFFTNSMHVPVWKQISPFDKIDIESQLTGYSSAGCITYVELESSVINNIDALEELVVYAMDKDIPYFAINVPNDTCLECGYTGEFNDACPVCGSTHIQQLRRVTGYLTGNYTTAFNLGKQDEVHHRVKHTGYME